MTTLSDRYVWAVLRALPGRERAELEPEIRSLVADAIEARAAQADVAPDDIERAALTELGDPGVLAAGYARGPQYLIGPNVYPEWRRLVTMLVSILVPIIALVVLSASLISGSTVGGAIVGAGVSAFQVALQTVFWITLVMATIERATGSVLTPRSWTPDALPKVPDDGRIGLMEVGAMLVFDVLVIAGLLWVQLLPPVSIGGVAYPLFDPALWSFWLPWFIAVMVLEIGFAILLAMRGRWTWTLAVMNAVLGAAFGIPVVYLVSNGLLLNPALLAAIGSTTDSDWVRVTALIVGVVSIVTVIADAAVGFMKAWRASLPGAVRSGRIEVDHGSAPTMIRFLFTGRPSRLAPSRRNQRPLETSGISRTAPAAAARAGRRFAGPAGARTRWPAQGS
jgi:hypothetical protein